MTFGPLLLLVSILPLSVAKCYDPSPAFPLPLWADGRESLQPTFNVIEQRLADLFSEERYDRSSFSLTLTSNTDDLWSYYHSARKHNASRPGVKHVNGDSLYRIASITKVFTVLCILQQHTAGNLSLDDPVSQYIPELAGPDSGDLPWKDITLRILGSQLSGIPRESMQADLINALPDPSQIGLPPASREGLPTCYEYSDEGRACNRTDLLESLKKGKPIFAPNAQSTYSNAGFELLGLVIENVTGMPYNDYVQQAIFDPIGMDMSSLTRPSDEHAVLPPAPNFWDADEGIHGPAGAIYSSATDLSMFVRYILTHFNTLATGVNWLLPASWAVGIHSFYGMPFEIFRTDSILEHSRRPVTFVTKGGGVPGYFSDIAIMPEYGLGLTILTASSINIVAQIREIITVELVRAAEKLIWKDVNKIYTGTYITTAPTLNSSIELSASPSTGLVMEKFVSNGTDVFAALSNLLEGHGVWQDEERRAQLVPTLLYKNETAQEGEIWRMLFVSVRNETEEASVWDDFCNTDVDLLAYAGLPVNEIVFWGDRVELPAWNLTTKRSSRKAQEYIVVQSWPDVVLIPRT